MSHLTLRTPKVYTYTTKDQPTGKPITDVQHRKNTSRWLENKLRDNKQLIKQHKQLLNVIHAKRHKYNMDDGAILRDIEQGARELVQLHTQSREQLKAAKQDIDAHLKWQLHSGSTSV